MAVMMCFVILVFLPAVATEYTPANAAQLRTQIFTNYNSKDRPTNQTVIDIDIGLMHINQFDIIMQELDCAAFLTSTWQDDRLQWNASDVGGMESFFTYRSDVWSPPLVISNSADDVKIINDNGDLESNPVLLQSNGSVLWVTPVNIVSQCTVNIKFYPFDTQICKIRVAPMMYLDEHVDLMSSAQNVNFDLYEESGEWDVADSSIKKRDWMLGVYKISVLEFSFQLKRKYSYYVLNMILPVIAIACLGPFVFMLPVEGGDKIGFSLTILLSLSVLLSLVSDSIPPTSTHVCGLSVYLIMTFILCTIETLVTVYVCRWHKWATEEEKMGPRAQNFTKFLAKVTLSRKHKDDNSREKSAAGEDPKQFRKKGSVDKAWETEKDDSKNFEDIYETPYTYHDLILFFDRFNFIMFSIINFLITIITMIAISVGGSA